MGHQESYRSKDSVSCKLIKGNKPLQNKNQHSLLQKLSSFLDEVLTHE